MISNRLTHVAHALCVLCLSVAVQDAAAQDQQPAPAEHVHPPPGGQPPATQVHQHEAMVSTLFSTREASGTAWLPDVTPMNGWHRRARGWEVMAHGNAFLQILHESAPEDRGETQGGRLGHGHGPTPARSWMDRTSDDDEPGACDHPGMRISQSAPDW